MKNQLRLYLRNNRAMTLMEMLGAVAVLGILAAVIMSNFDFAFDKSKIAGVTNDLKTMTASTEHYFQQNSKLPTVTEFNAFSDIKINLTPLPSTSTEITFSGGVPVTATQQIPSTANLANGDFGAGLLPLPSDASLTYYETVNLDPWQTPYLVTYRDKTALPYPVDIIFFYSDGVDKTFNTSDDLFITARNFKGRFQVSSGGFSRRILDM